MTTSSLNHEDIVYRSDVGDLLLGRLYRPQAKPAFAVVEVHGGGWTSGDRLNNAVICQALCEAGVAVFSLDFRIPPVARYPAALEDVNYGIRWFKKNAASLGLAPAFFGGLGTSSGGHLLLTTALRPDDYAPEDDAAIARQSGHLDFVVACWPVADPLARYRMAKEKGIQNLLAAHHAFWPGEAEMERANPYLMLTRGDDVRRPPILLLQGTADSNVEHERADSFADAYRARGGEIELVKFPGAPHAFITRDPDTAAAKHAFSSIVRFVTDRISQEETING